MELWSNLDKFVVPLPLYAKISCTIRSQTWSCIFFQLIIIISIIIIIILIKILIIILIIIHNKHLSLLFTIFTYTAISKIDLYYVIYDDDELGTGAYSKVYGGLCKRTGKEVLEQQVDAAKIYVHFCTHACKNSSYIIYV